MPTLIAQILALINSPFGQDILMRILGEHGVTVDILEKAIGQLPIPNPPSVTLSRGLSEEVSDATKEGAKQGDGVKEH